jgi:glycine/D-amino acid oxidase-like deaminating enzyme
MTNIVIVGCGVVGAAIAYELSQNRDWAITVIDQHPPAQVATGAALGVLMGAISQKAKGKNLKMRLSSIHTYDAWIPQLEAVTGQRIPYNRQGILRLCFAGEDLDFWHRLAEIRQQQGWRLEVGDGDRLRHDYPQLNLDRVIGAVYSPQDRQVNPVALTLALVAAAQHNGVTFKFGETVVDTSSNRSLCQQVHTTHHAYSTDWLILAAGLGSTPLTASLHQSVALAPVLGQAVHMQLNQGLGKATLQPVITGEDVHIVPLGEANYWIGATVEFAGQSGEAIADVTRLEGVVQQAIALCPALVDGTIVRTWSGLRPRPEGRPAPIIEPLPGYNNILLATGHYRNGVLLAPATATIIRQIITDSRN